MQLTHSTQYMQRSQTEEATSTPVVAMEIEEQGQVQAQNPLLILANKVKLICRYDYDETDKDRLREEVYATIIANNMVTLYDSLVKFKTMSLNQEVMDKMCDNINQELRILDEKIVDAEENLGESEVREAHLAKFMFYIRIGDKENAWKQMEVTDGKTVAVAQRMDLVFHTLQIALFDMDFWLMSKIIDKAKKLFEEGDDWERKNRLKVYEGLYWMSTFEFKKASDLFLDSISTFTTYELFPYETFIFYTVLTSVISLDRVSLKEKVVDAPEIQTIIGNIPYLREFLTSFYECQYNSFLSTLDGLTKQMRLDRYLWDLSCYFQREVKANLYSQFLESHGRVKIEAVANAFGMAVDRMDMELQRYRALGKLHFKLDKANGEIDPNSLDTIHAQYPGYIKRGDSLMVITRKLSQIAGI